MSSVPESPFLLRRFQSLLGIIPIGAFFCEHAFTNSLAYFYGPERFNQAVEFLQGLPFVLFLEIFLIGIPILLHAAIGFYIWIFCQNNVLHYGYLRNWLYSLQRWTGILAFIFIAYHVYKLRIEWTFNPDVHHIDFAYVQAYFSEAWHVVFYFVGVAACSFHFANGLWNFLIKWGITVGERAQSASGYVCSLIGVGVFSFFMSSLYAFS
ncbi:MAG: succinate dehydrogenase [Candidatus Hinthialibacter sp.]